MPVPYFSICFLSLFLTVSPLRIILLISKSTSLSIISYCFLSLDTSSYSRRDLLEREMLQLSGVGAFWILCSFIYSINQTKSFSDTVLLSSILALTETLSFNIYLGV